MTESDDAKQIVIEELEELLEAEFPDEADSAGLYVEDPASFAGVRREQVAGVPSGGVIMLAGPIILQWLSAIALAFAEEVRKEALGAGAKWLVGLVKKLFGHDQPPPAATTKAETVAAITASLIKAGWNAGKAGAAAERVWEKGRRAGHRIARR